MSHARLAALATAALLTGAADAPPPVLAHHGPWNVHTSENACLLARTFGEAESEVSIGFQPLFNAQSGEVQLLTAANRGERSRGEATITQRPSGRVEKGDYFSAILESGKRATRIAVPRAVWDGLSDTDVIEIDAPPVSVRLKLVRFGAAKSIFDTCERTLLKSWNVDPIVLDPEHAPTPVDSAARYFRSSDYPMGAASAGRLGRVVAILDVGVDGTVTGCRIASNSWPALNKATCRGARRMRFTPGRDAAGKVAASIYVTSVRWSLPG